MARTTKVAGKRTLFLELELLLAMVEETMPPPQPSLYQPQSQPMAEL
jgi:hypothetical protein